MKNSFFIFFFIICLFFTFTNFVYFSAVPSVIFSPLILILLFSKSINKICFYLSIYFFVSFLSIILYHYQSFFSFSFFRFDGNFIISYMPLLILPFFNLNINLSKLLLFYFSIVLIINIIAIVQNFNFNGNHFHSFFVAHNAAGGFISIVCAYFFCNFLEKKKLFSILLLIISVYILYLTHSRGSLLGLALALISYYFWNKRQITLIYLLFLSLILFELWLIYQYYDVYLKIGSNNVLEYISNDLNINTVSKANIYIRLLSDWPRAVNCFLESPIFGTGFGSINDIPFRFKEITPFFSYNSQEIKTFSSSHAHHSFFHILGEQGLFGLFIFLLFWISIFNYLKKQEKSIMRNFLILTFWTITFSSLTEHRITTPATMIPFCIILGLYIANQNYLKKSTLTNPTE